MQVLAQQKIYMYVDIIELFLVFSFNKKNEFN